MKTELKKILEKISNKDFDKIKQIYKMTNKIEGNTIDEFVNNVPNDKVCQGIINLCNKI